jgi:hypothetical protein
MSDTPFERIMLSKLFPIRPKESSFASRSGPSSIDSDREGDRGRPTPVNNPLRVDTPIGGLGVGACEREELDDMDEAEF